MLWVSLCRILLQCVLAGAGRLMQQWPCLLCVEVACDDLACKLRLSSWGLYFLAHATVK